MTEGGKGTFELVVLLVRNAKQQLQVIVQSMGTYSKYGYRTYLTSVLLLLCL